MIRKTTDGDISNEEFEAILKPFIDDYGNFIYSYVMPEIINIDNEKCYVPERLTEEQYLKKYKNKYSIIRLIRDYTK